MINTFVKRFLACLLTIVVVCSVFSGCQAGGVGSQPADTNDADSNGNNGLKHRIDKLEKTVMELESKLSDSSKDDESDAGLTQQIEDLTGMVNDLQSQLAAAQEIIDALRSQDQNLLNVHIFSSNTYQYVPIGSTKTTALFATYPVSEAASISQAWKTDASVLSATVVVYDYMNNSNSNYSVKLLNVKGNSDTGSLSVDVDLSNLPAEFFARQRSADLFLVYQHESGSVASSGVSLQVRSDH